MRNTPDCINRLQAAGVSYDDAYQLRRISMTLHRWHELECGDGNGCIIREEKWAIERCAHPASDRLRWWNGSDWVRKPDRRTYDDYDKAKMMEGLPTTNQWGSADFARANAQGFPSQGAWRDTGSKPYYESAHHNGRTLVADREADAKRRLARIMARYPHLSAYVQTDPRGCALYILRPGDVPEGQDVSSYYNRGVAVYK